MLKPGPPWREVHRDSNDPLTEQPGEIGNQRQCARRQRDHNHRQASRHHDVLSVSIGHVDSLTKVIAARSAQPIPLGLNKVVAILALQEHLLLAVGVLHIRQPEVGA